MKNNKKQCRKRGIGWWDEGLLKCASLRFDKELKSDKIEYLFHNKTTNEQLRIIMRKAEREEVVFDSVAKYSIPIALLGVVLWEFKTAVTLQPSHIFKYLLILVGTLLGVAVLQIIFEKRRIIYKQIKDEAIRRLNP